MDLIKESYIKLGKRHPIWIFSCIEKIYFDLIFTGTFFSKDAKKIFFNRCVRSTLIDLWKRGGYKIAQYAIFPLHIFMSPNYSRKLSKAPINIVFKFRQAFCKRCYVFFQDQIDLILYRNIPMPDAKRACILSIFPFFGILVSNNFFSGEIVPPDTYQNTQRGDCARFCACA